MKNVLWILAAAFAASCATPAEAPPPPSGIEVRLITLDPGHFHASLVQKVMYPEVSPLVRVYAPDGAELRDHLARIAGFNSRPQDPTRWQEDVYKGPDFLERMIREKKGNVVIISGNNRDKARYIKASVDAGLNVFADKPMCIDPEGFALVKVALEEAGTKGLLLYDIMTERSEITTVLQRELAAVPAVFGELSKGTPAEPAVVMASVHHFFKSVSGAPLVRPAWFFDVAQQGEGLADVAVHLVDLVPWVCFPDRALGAAGEAELVGAERWPTSLSRSEFKAVTNLEDFPDYLKKDVRAGALQVYGNGRIDYRLRGVHVRVTVTWNFQPPEGGGDAHFSVIRGTKAHLLILQEKEQRYRPELYVQAAPGVAPKDLAESLGRAVSVLEKKYPGLSLAEEKGRWRVVIPDAFRVGHEAHFGQVTERFLQYLKDGRLPAWEIANMTAKYDLTTRALALARARDLRKDQALPAK